LIVDEFVDDTDKAIESLKGKGFSIGVPYVQAVDRVGGLMYVPVNGVAMTFEQLRDLDAGRASLEEIAAENSQR
jgi:hypothetical protein